MAYDHKNFELAIADAIKGVNKTHGDYQSRWGKVSRLGTVVAYIEGDVAIATEKTSKDELLTLRSLGTDDLDDTSDIQSKLDAFKVAQDDDTASKTPEIPKLELVPESVMRKSRICFALRESLPPDKDLVKSVIVPADVSLEIYNDRFEYIDGNDVYESQRFRVFLWNYEDAEDLSEEVFEYNVSHKSLPPSTEVILKTLMSEVKDRLSFARVETRHLEKVAAEVAARMQASLKYLSDKALEESAVVRKLSKFLIESESEVAEEAHAEYRSGNFFVSVAFSKSAPNKLHYYRSYGVIGEQPMYSDADIEVGAESAEELIDIVLDSDNNAELAEMLSANDRDAAVDALKSAAEKIMRN